MAASEADSYRENGFVLVKGLFSRDEALHLREEAHALATRLEQAGRNIDATWGSARTDDTSRGLATQVLNCHDVQFHSAVFTRVVSDERFTSAASRVTGLQNIRLHHTKLFIKPPENGSPFPMHQDYPYFPHAMHSVFAAVIHFDDAPEEKGCLRVYPGSHRLGPLPHNPAGGWHLPPSEWSIEAATACPAHAGDVLFFSYLTVHGSGVNSSSEARTTLLVQMRDPHDPPTQDVHVSRGQGMMLHGINRSASPYPPPPPR